MRQHKNYRRSVDAHFQEAVTSLLVAFLPIKAAYTSVTDQSRRKAL